MNLGNQNNTLYSVHGYLWETVTYTQKLIHEFGDITKDDIKKFPNIEWTYLQVIVINLAKIFSSSNNEPFSLKQFKKFCTDDLSDVIITIENEHQMLISKIKINRDKLFVHTDKHFYEMKFSDHEVKRLESAFGNDFSALRAEYKHMERYSPGDLRHDVADIKAILIVLDTILKRFITEVM